jgi:polyribonucleotide nucleotidyltransferase
MSAGVPIKRPVAGIAMGLITDGKENHKILSDIKDVEDHFGDMDFKVAGTECGITALQMDIKVKGISLEFLKIALGQAKVGRLFILDKMLAVIDKPRKELSEFAPKIHRINIPVEKIGELIGPGGKVIKGIIEKSGAEVSIDEDPEKKIGVVCISSSDQESIDIASELVEGYARELKIDDEFDGQVTRVEGYGAFVKLVANKEGLLHISAMSKDYVRDAGDLYKVGDEIHVRLSEIQDDGKIKLSTLTKEEEKEKQASAKPRRFDNRDSRPRRDDSRQGMTRFKKY